MTRVVVVGGVAGGMSCAARARRLDESAQIVVLERGEHVSFGLDDGTRVPADVIVLAAGVRPDTQVFEDAGVACERGAIVVDQHGRTSLDGVWAVGDATVSVDPVTGVRRPVARGAGQPCRPAGRRRNPPTGACPADPAAAAAHGRDRAHHGAPAPEPARGILPRRDTDFSSEHPLPSRGRAAAGRAGGRCGGRGQADRLIATAIRARMGVADLIDLDLSYSPPYGQAKDAVNLAGMVGQNVLDGTLRLWHAHELDTVLASALVLDVRSRDEFASGRLPGAVNIPHTELRERLEQVRLAAGDRAVRVLCASGVRSAIAHRVLAQAGFDSASLSGGMLALRAALGHDAARVLTTEGEPAHV